MKTVGVLGGMGPAATAHFLARIAAATDAARDQDHLHVIVDSRPSVPDRSAYLTSPSANENPRHTLIRMAQGLEAAGADLLVIACNTANVWRDDVVCRVGVPVIDWAGEVADHLRGLGERRVALLATAGTVNSGLYHAALGVRGLSCVTPDAADQRLLDAAICGIKAGGGRWDVVSDIAWTFMRLQPVLLACTELSMLAHRAESGFFYDAADIVARRVIELAGGRVRA